METYRNLLLLIFLLVCDAAPPLRLGHDAVQNFKKFTTKLLLGSNFKDLIEQKGASISNPFGEGIMLANLVTKVWDIPTEGFDKVLNVPSYNIVAEYIELLRVRMNMAGFQIKSVLYSNSTVPIPDATKGLKTNLKMADFSDNWESTRKTINDMISENTGGTLNDQLIPKGSSEIAAFEPYTDAVFINTNYFKSNWAKKWTSAGTKTMSDDFSMEFLQTEGKFPMLVNSLWTAVAIPLQDTSKHAVFVLSKTKFDDFLGEGLANVLKNADPNSWPVSKETQTVQVPKLKINLLYSYIRDFGNFGIKNTFCPDEVFDRTSTSSTKAQSKRKPFFAGSDVQANHLEITDDFVEIASATEVSINSDEKLRKFLQDRESPSQFDQSNDRPKSAVRSSEPAMNPATKSVQNSAPKTTPKPMGSSDNNTIPFDKPFFWYLHDKELGPVNFAIVESLNRDELPINAQWFQDYYKSSFWTCPQIRG